MNVLVVGSGAIGGYFGALLTRRGHHVAMLARGEHLVALRERGIEIEEGPDAGTFRVHAVASVAEAPPPDLVLIAVKAYDTEAACRALVAVLGDAVVLELQNGIDRADQMNAILGDNRVLPGVVYMETQLTRPGTIRYLSGARRIVFGESRRPTSPRVRQLHEVLLDAGINAEVADDMPTELWRKFVLVCAANALTALTRQPFGELVSSPQGRRVVADIINEGVTVGRAVGAAFAPNAVETSVQFLEDMGPRLRSSMLRDIEAGRETEIDALSGTLVREAERLGMDAPLSRLVWVAVGLQSSRMEGSRERHSDPSGRCAPAVSRGVCSIRPVR